MRFSRSTSGTATRRAAFSLVELLVVITIIGLLGTLIVVAVTGAIARGRDAGTEQFLRSIAFSAEQFHSDFGYHPPLMNDAIRSDRPGLLIQSHGQQSVEMLERARFHSIFTLPVYLVGMGYLQPDPPEPGESNDVDPESHDGRAGPGFRDPGRDRAWGGAADRSALNPTRRGRVFGPYLDVGSGENMRLINDEEDLDDHPNIDYEQVRGMYIFVDRWDRPIRYYSQIPTRDHRETPPEISLNRVPIELLSAEVVADFSAARPLDAARERDLLNAPFALLSGGSDEIYADIGFALTRIDEDFSNTDMLNDAFDEDEQFARANLLRSLRNNIRVAP